MPDTLTKPQEDTRVTPQLTEPGDHDLFSHYAKKEDIMEATVTGKAIRALCGKLWTPRFADGERFPTCPDCQDIYDNVLKK